MAGVRGDKRGLGAAGAGPARRDVWLGASAVGASAGGV